MAAEETFIDEKVLRSTLLVCTMHVVLLSVLGWYRKRCSERSKDELEL